MKKYQPYTYLIKFKPTEQLYYGVRTAKDCYPEDLWVKYFTSSKVVKGLIKEYGSESFEIVSIKLHETKEDARNWEEIYLISVNAGYNEEYLNKHNGGGKNWTTAGCSPHNLGIPMTDQAKNNLRIKKTGIEFSESHRKHISEGNIGKKDSEETRKKKSEASLGVPKSEEHKKHMSESQIGKHHSEEAKKHMSENSWMLGKTGELSPTFGTHWTEEHKQNHSKIMSGEGNPWFGLFGEVNPLSKKYIITFPDNHEEVIIGIREFSKNNNLDSSAMIKVAKGKNKQHKDFKCRYFIED